MNSTTLTVVGNVVDSPRRVRLENGSVTNFRMAATERRFDSAQQTWIDGGTLWIDVECWGELGGNVSHTVSKGDPVIVIGSLTTRQWESEHGRRSAPQIRASAVGPNLARGTAEFRKIQRGSTAPAAEPPVAEQPAEEGFSGELAGDRSGLDYETVSDALKEMDSDPLLAPALR